MQNDLIERLLDGCRQCGESDNGAIELFDIEAANELMDDASEAIVSLLSIARRWVALDAGAWAVDRHASEKAELLAATRALIAQFSETPTAAPSPSQEALREALVAARPIITSLIDAEYNVETWGLRQRLAAIDAALAQSAAPVAPEDPYWKGAYERMADRNVVLSEAVKSAILVLDDLATGQGIDIPIEQIIRDLNAVAHTGGAPASPDDPYDRGRRDILNALLAPNPAIAAKIAKWAEPPHDPDPEGRLPFDVALWITEVAEQLGIKSLEELGEASPVQQAAPSGEGE